MTKQKLKVNFDYLHLPKLFSTEYKEMDFMTQIIDNEEKDTYFIYHLGVYRPDNNNNTPIGV